MVLPGRSVRDFMPPTLSAKAKISKRVIFDIAVNQK
jgi:hypothetical protein